MKPVRYVNVSAKDIQRIRQLIDNLPNDKQTYKRAGRYQKAFSLCLGITAGTLLTCLNLTTRHAPAAMLLTSWTLLLAIITLTTWLGIKAFGITINHHRYGGPSRQEILNREIDDITKQVEALKTGEATILLPLEGGGYITVRENQ